MSARTRISRHDGPTRRHPQIGQPGSLVPMIGIMSSVRPLVFIALLLACNTDGSDTTTTTTGITGVSSATMTAGPTSVATDDVTSAPTTGGAATATTGATSEPMTTSEDSLDTTGLVATGEDPPPSVDLPPPPPEGDYAALVIPGDPVRLSVRKADKDNDTCTTITFLSPADGSPLEYDVQLPATWFAQGALIHQGAAGCLTFEGFPVEPVMAYSGNGSATWNGACPATVDIDVTLAFQQELPWVPVEVLLQEPAVPATGC